MVGDGYRTVRHCENVDVELDVEPDAGPIYCAKEEEKRVAEVAP